VGVFMSKKDVSFSDLLEIEYDVIRLLIAAEDKQDCLIQVQEYFTKLSIEKREQESFPNN
jgi:hypothetical protein